MNPSHPQDSTEVTHLEKLRTQLSTDMEAMHEKEASLREYEQRLRLLIEHAPQNRPPEGTTQHYHFTTGADQGSLDAAWEKHNRAHALLEAARRGLSDDRMALKDREEQVMIREQEVARREAWVKVREQEVAAKAMPAPIKAQARATGPFAAARKMLSGKSA
jgi:predicted  nucleic acid-binding Zn-ribbon protein